MTTPERRHLRIIGFERWGDLGPFTLYRSHRKRVVVFLKAPPRKPPCPAQVWQRNRFRQAAEKWNSLPASDRRAWTLAAKRASLGISGYSFFMSIALTQDLLAKATVERHTGITLNLSAVLKTGWQSLIHLGPLSLSSKPINAAWPSLIHWGPVSIEAKPKTQAGWSQILPTPPFTLSANP